MRAARLFASSSILFFALTGGCGSPDGPGLSEAQQGVTTKVPTSRADLFRSDALYTVVVRGLDPRQTSVPALQALRARADRDPSVKDYVDSAGAGSLELYATDSRAVACDAAPLTAEARFFATASFGFGVKGNKSVTQPKPPHRLRFRAKNERLFGLKSVDLNAMYNDPSHMREAMVWRMLGEAGQASSRTAYAKLCVENGGALEYRGLFLLVERVDDVFLEDRFPARAKGNLYDVAVPNASVGATLERREGGPAAYARLFPLSDGRLPEATYTLDTNNEDDDPAELKTYGDLAAFIDTLNGETPALSNLGEGRFASDAYARELDAIFNTRGFLRWAAINTLAGSWDNYLCTPGNYRLYNAGRGDTGDFMKAPYFYWVPWDYDNSLGVNYFAGADWATVPLLRPWEACGPYWQSVGGGPTPAPVPVLLANMLQNPTYRGYYLAFVEHALATWFHADWVAQRVGPDTVAGDSAAGLWSILRPSVYGETLGAGTEAPFTQRLWTNDEIFRHLFRSERLQRPSEGRDVQSLTNFMNRRATRAREELAGLPPPPAVDFRSVRVEAPPG